MKHVTLDYEVVDHGVNNSSYFCGCGTVYTGYTESFTGIGSSAAEALEDALEQAATSDWNVDIVTDKLSDKDRVGEDAEDTYYYVSIRVREFDPARDEPHMEQIAGSINRLDHLSVEIHNAQTPSGDRSKLHELQAERDTLEAFLREHDIKLTPSPFNR